MSKTQITAEPGIPQIITREFDAPRDLVFRGQSWKHDFVLTYIRTGPAA